MWESCPKQVMITVAVDSYYTLCNGNPNTSANLSAFYDGACGLAAMKGLP